MSEEKVNIGNYKGVMLCNRPNQSSENSKRNRAFISRVDPKEPIGWNPVKKQVYNVSKPKPKEILTRHRKWLARIQENRMRALKENEDIERQKATKKETFQTSMSKQRKRLLNTVDPEEKKQILSGQYEEDDLNTSKPRAQTADPSTKKPKWALTEEEAVKQEENEVDDLLKFVEDLDYDEIVNDLEVRMALEVVKEKVTKLIESKPDLKEKFIARQEEKKKARLEGKTIKTEASKEDTDWGSVKSESVVHDQDWDPNSKDSDPKKKYQKLVKKIADKILKENPFLKAIHSNSSIRKLMENEILTSIGAQPPVVSVVKETSTRKDVIDASNLPYLHRNPAV